MFFNVLSFSFIFFVFDWFSKSDFFLGLNFVSICIDNSYVKNQFLGPSRVVKKPFGPSFPFFPTFFSRFFFFFLFISSFFDFLYVFHFFHFSEEKVSSFLFS